MWNKDGLPCSMGGPMTPRVEQEKAIGGTETACLVPPMACIIM